MTPTVKGPAQVAFERETTLSVGEKMTRLLNKVRTRAYELFEQRGRENGHDLDDWVQAENELGILPSATIDETRGEIRLRIDGADFTADELKVYVEPRAITVEATSAKTTKSDDAEQSMERGLFGRYELPAAINTDVVKATLHNGVLEVVATRAVQPVQEPGEPKLTGSNSQKEKSVAA
jgi:HSP20 family molecular chaperone IbpA